ncbi:hypothetical protein A2625_03730 [candidate division WOR-1 bacterium RIFCSPHIGHO2_01_FULL_53_15]|uniref:Uncharacterized protein n=1 Tax=candidate division WOR-1 bacterium RIFCSPHIGHO2_01_FULL_53_15 TaxID=1802564 RepID=A0A1F4Q049_UNCSA|nr:MAG: hypothetical protein A2625_03730 [candidate division WOR-1 bacterium RIFCSPHIGHO2_01_FULL_53_15]OGC12880.1 MAG: hypothetical protein A3D23_04760 [candidate division WOR-1 bacterium RIFCSPHIGHO2_02_FULL_53_26]
MKEIHGLGAFGIMPYFSEDLLKQTRLANIKTRAGKVAYLLSMGDKAKKPQVKEGVYEARGALKWIAKLLEEEE